MQFLPSLNYRSRWHSFYTDYYRNVTKSNLFETRREKTEALPEVRSPSPAERARKEAEHPGRVDVEKRTPGRSASNRAGPSIFPTSAWRSNAFLETISAACARDRARASLRVRGSGPTSSTAPGVGRSIAAPLAFRRQDFDHRQRSPAARITMRSCGLVPTRTATPLNASIARSPNDFTRITKKRGTRKSFSASPKLTAF